MQTSPNQLFKEGSQKFIWESAAPERPKSRVKRGQSAKPNRLNNTQFSKSGFNSVTPANRKFFASYATKETLPPSYAIQYLGVTNGQIGIWTKRTTIPQLSPLESCKDVPLPLIYSSVPEKKSPTFIEKLVKNNPTPIQDEYNIEEVKDGSQVSTEEEGVAQPNPELYDQYIIHTYARPRCLSSYRKSREQVEYCRLNPEFHKVQNRFQLKKSKVVEAPMYRTGVSGWKLTRPRSSMSIKKRKSRTAPKQKSSTPLKFHEKESVESYYNEPYLKFLAQKGFNIKKSDS